jgi:O-antigen/teichoic acid export membrane protein
MTSTKNQTLTQTTISSSAWAYASRYSGKLLVYISMIILARLLSKEDFGLAGFALVIVAYLEAFSDLGASTALIYHRESTDVEDTTFWISLGTGIGLMILTWLIAPMVGIFFKDARAVPLTRALSLVFPISAFGSTHIALLKKRMAFQRTFIPETALSAVKGGVSILFAALGYGAWSIIIGQVAGFAASSIASWIVLPWRPSFMFSRNAAKSLLSYGLGILAISILGVLAVNIDYLFVGRFLGAVELSIYTIAYRLPEVLLKGIYSTLSNVLFPAFSTLRSDPIKMQAVYLRTVKFVILLTVPLGLGMALTARPFILTFFTDKWEDAIPVMQAISIHIMLHSFTFNAGSLYQAQGKLKLHATMIFLKAILTVVVLWIVISTFGTIQAIAWSLLIVSSADVFLNMGVLTSLFKFRLGTLLNSFRPGILAGLGMAAILLLLLPVLENIPTHLLQLLIEALLGAILYFGFLWFIDRDALIKGAVMVRKTIRRTS